MGLLPFPRGSPMTPPSSDARAAALPAAEAARGQAGEQARDPALGIAYMVIAAGLFSVMDALIKWLGPSYPTMQIVFFRSLFAFVPLAIFMMRSGALGSLATRHPMGHVWRAVIGFVAMSSFFYAYARMLLANVVALSFAAPLFITALSVPLLGESVGIRRWSAVVVGFLGVIIMVRPDASIFESVALVPLAGSVFYALAMIYVRKLSKTESSAAIVFYYTLACTLISAGFMPFQWVAPDTTDLMLLIALGCVGGLAQIFMTNAFRNGPAALIAPFDYVTMVWVVMLGYFIWGDIPDVNIWIGVAIVIGSGVYIARREGKLGLRRGVARPLQPKR